MNRLITTAAGLATAMLVTASASATDAPFIETFDAGAASWFNETSTGELAWVSSGGIGDSGYVTAQRNFSDLVQLPIPGNPIPLFRAHDEFDSSNDAFVGNWLADGVQSFSFSVRHNAPVPVTYFARFAGPNGAIAGVSFAPVFTGAWTNLTIDIDLSNPTLFFEGPQGDPNFFNAVFSDIDRIQIGVFAEGLVNFDQAFQFDLDNVSMNVPAPGTLALLGLAALTRRRRRA